MRELAIPGILDAHPMGGEVRIALSTGDYVAMTPKQARDLAMRLLVNAADAEGKHRPDLITIRDALR